MSNAGMTMHAGNAGDIGGTAFNDVMHQIRMTLQTVVLKNARVLRLDHDWLMKVLERESLRMVIAVLGLRDPFINPLMRQMTIDALGVGVVARFRPRIILVVHDVAVDACARILAEIRKPARVGERYKPHANGGAEDKREERKKPFSGEEAENTLSHALKAVLTIPTIHQGARDL
jgi:hypothetical protein